MYPEVTMQDANHLLFVVLSLPEDKANASFVHEKSDETQLPTMGK